MRGGKAFTVGEVLRLFCSTLKEQIKHRYSALANQLAADKTDSFMHTLWIYMFISW